MEQTILVNGKKVIYIESRGMYTNSYQIILNEPNLTDDELVDLLCPCGLVFGYRKFGDNYLDVNVD